MNTTNTSMNTETIWWLEQNDDARWVHEQVRQYEEERFYMEQAARRWAAAPEQLELPLEFGEEV